MIEIRNLNLTIKNNKILEDINLDLLDNGMSFIIGESGSGKTTLLSCLSGFLNYNGSILYNGNEVKDNKIYLRKNVYGIVYQNLNIVNNLTCYECLKMSLDSANIVDNQDHRIKKYLELVQLSKYKNSYAGLLSGGEMQRLGLAIALVREPKVLICDEVISALDKINKFLILDILKKYSKDNLVIISSHDKDILDSYADLVIEIKDRKATCHKKISSSNNYEVLNRNKKSIINTKLIFKAFKYILLLTSLFVFVISFFIGFAIHEDRDYSYDDNISYLVNDNGEIINGTFGIYEDIYENGGTISLGPKYLSETYIKYGSLFKLNINEEVKNYICYELYVEDLNYNLICGDVISNYDEIIIDKYLADMIINKLTYYGYKNMNYDYLINNMSINLYHCDFKIKGISNCNFCGVYVYKDIYFNFIKNSSLYYRAYSNYYKYYKKESYDFKLTQTKDVVKDKMNVYTNLFLGNNHDFNVIGGITNPISERDIVFESETDYNKFKLWCRGNSRGSLNQTNLIITSNDDNIEIVSGRRPSKANEILLPYYFEGVDSEFLNFNFLDTFEVSGYYRLDYDIDFISYPLVFVSDLGYLKLNNDPYYRFFVYNLDDLKDYRVISVIEYNEGIKTNNVALEVVLYSVLSAVLLSITVLIIYNIYQNKKKFISMRLLGVGEKELLLYSVIEFNKILLYYIIPQVVLYIIFVIFRLYNYIFNGLFISLAIVYFLLNIINLIFNIIVIYAPINRELKKKY